MTSDRDNGAETNTIINIEARGTSVPDTIVEDSSGSATMDIESDWTILLRHGPQQEKADAPLSDILESAFKGLASPLSTTIPNPDLAHHKDIVHPCIEPHVGLPGG